MTDYIVWGVPKGETEERLLLSERAGLRSMDEANRAIKVLEGLRGCRQCRVQVVNLSGNPTDDLIRAVR